jgi:HEAT repeat protein
MASNENIRRIQQSGDWEKLAELLHTPQDAELRQAAAQALGELLELDAVEPLIRSTLLDPDPLVQKAARQALEEILGNRAQEAISNYPVDPIEKETWLHPVNASILMYEDDDEDNDETGDMDEEAYRQDEIIKTAETGGWMGDDLTALITILRTEGNVNMRVRAARALGQMVKVDMKAVNALAETALWSDSPSVRSAATDSLVKLFGDKEADELLHTYREAKGITGWNDDFYKDEVREDLDEADAAEAEDLEKTADRSSVKPASEEHHDERTDLPAPLPYSGHSPVVQDESDGKGVLVVLIVIIILVLVGLAFYLGLFS